MWEIFTYPFFQNAIAGVLILSIASAIIGTYIVTRRMVSISGGITHACFGGLGLGYFLGINPVIAAAVVAVCSSLGVEQMSRRMMREDSAIAVIWALGMAMGVFFVFLTPGYVPELNSFLFGNVLTIAPSDLLAFGIFTIVLVIFIAIFYRQVVACAFDRDFAQVVHMPVRFITISMTVLIAVCIVLTIRLVGVMLLMSMLAMPQIIAEVFCRRFSTMMFCSIAISIVCCLTGLILSAWIDVPCSALIVMVMVGAYITARTANWLLKRRSSSFILIAAITISSALSSCSLKQNTAATRQYTAFITRYNIYFNGDEHYKETLEKMEREYADDYSRTLFMHPAEAKTDEKAPQPNGDFKRSIEKAQKAIQLRSIKKRPKRKPGKSSDPEYKKWLKREEYNPFLHNAWMMMGRSQYMNGDFLGASATFYYIAKHFSWLPETVTEAKLWQARCYCAIDWLFDAESILSKIKEKEIADNNTLKGLYYFSYADFYVRSHEYKKAAPMLEEAMKYTKGAQKTRLTFLLGQVHKLNGNYTEAYNAFNKVGSSSSANYRTRFNARIKQSEVFQGDDIKKEVKSLEAMTKYGSNKEFLDQIYYAIGNLYISRADTTNAIANYEKAVSLSTRNGIDKALAQIALGGLYYEQHRYDKAQPCYSEAVPQLPETHPNYKALSKRSDVLDELAVYAQNVTTQDSLLRLADMSPEEQLKVINKTIEDLKRREKEERENAEREEYLAKQAAAGTGLQQGSVAAPTTFNLNTDKSWYFYNEATRNAGRTEFQKRWGSRKLEDDWRRRNKTTYAPFSDEETDSETENEEAATTDSDVDSNSQEESSAEREARERASDPHFPEYYLNQIPSTPEERQTSHDVIQEGLYNMGVILKDKLDDIPSAAHQFNRLLTEYPENAYRLDTYYNMYLMYARTGDNAKAEVYRSIILEQFPESRQGIALADPQYMEKLMRMPEMEQALYDQAYEAYMTNNNTRVHEIYNQVRQDYAMSRIMPKFMFLEALSYVTENNSEKFSEVLQQLVSSYPDTDVSPLASAYLKQLSEGRKLQSSGSNVRGMVWSTRLTADSSVVSTSERSEFDFDSNGEQTFVLIYAANKVNGNQLLFEIARHNFSSYDVSDFDIEQMRFGNLGMITVAGFINGKEAAQYRTTLEQKNYGLIRSNVVPVIISSHDFNILLTEGRTLEEYFEAAGDNRIERIHDMIVQPEEDESIDITSNQSSLNPQNTQITPSAPNSQSTPNALNSQITPATPAPAEPSTTPSVEEKEPLEEEPYDIPIPMLPKGVPPIAPRVK